MDNFDAELRKWLSKPPAESVEAVLERLLQAPEAQREKIAEVIGRLLKPEPRAKTEDEELVQALLAGLLALVEVLQLGLEIRQAANSIREAAEAGNLAVEDAKRMMKKLVAAYNSAERTYAPLIDAFMKYQAKLGTCQHLALGLLEGLDADVLAIEVRRAINAR